jgi:hypothetical protein
MTAEGVQLEPVLRRALHRAGIVESWLHKCRRQGCDYVETAQDDELRRCPRCQMKLWPSGQVRPIRFHHLRHTTASLLLMRGADVAAVQRILRHSDPRLTTETYGHLVPDYLRSQIDRLSFGLQSRRPRLATTRKPSPRFRLGLLLFCSRSLKTWEKALPQAISKLNRRGDLKVVGATGFEPATFCSQSRRATRLRYAPCGASYTLGGHRAREVCDTFFSSARRLAEPKSRSPRLCVQCLR